MLKKTSIFILVAATLLMGCSVRTGLDNARRDDFSMFKGKAVGVVTNHTAVDRSGKHLVDLLHDTENITIKAIFGPEHGFRGDEEGGIYLEDNTDPKSGAPVYSLYGRNRKPTSEMLEGVDLLIFDIQDIGARFYTYITTMGFAMESAAENGLPIYILDRPNPIGRLAEGPVREEKYHSTIGFYPIPIRHGMTVGELALMIKDQGWINDAEKLDLHIVKVSGWDPAKPYVKTGLKWIDPSPNMRNINEALLYPGMCLFEATNFSDGRGTERPFEWVGANYVEPEKVIAELEKHNIRGIGMKPVEYVPVDMPGYAMNPKYKGETVRGLELTVSDPVHFKSVEFGVHLIRVLQDLYPDKFEMRAPRMGRTWGNDTFYTMILEGKSAEDIIKAYHEELKQFIAIRGDYLLY